MKTEQEYDNEICELQKKLAKLERKKEDAKRGRPMRKFRIYAVCELTEDQIWSDCDSPESPTTEDVAKELNDYGDMMEVIDDWSLFKDPDIKEGSIWFEVERIIEN
jgi:hypothetical protein